VADLKEDHRRRDAAGQHADFGIARRYLRMGMRLMRGSCVYLPPSLRNENPLGQWRAMIQELYGLELKLTGKTKARG